MYNVRKVGIVVSGCSLGFRALFCSWSRRSIWKVANTYLSETQMSVYVGKVYDLSTHASNASTIAA